MVTEDDNSDILNLEFVAKCEGRYSVSVNMYGVGVKGSPMVVDILCSEMRLYRNSKRWLYKLYKQKIINEFLAFNSKPQHTDPAHASTKHG